MTVNRTNRSTRGFTLIEATIAVGISVLAFGAVASMLLFGAKSTALIGNYADMNRYDLRALDQMTTDIRQAASVISCSSTQLKINAVDMSTGTNSVLTYTYSPTAGTLTRALSGTTNTLLSGIVSNSFSFGMYQRNPIGGSVSNYATTNVSLCKVVQISWNCSRSIMGIGETESVQSTEVVIRKE